jgi:ABC-2 type transport system ATP-binding protein
VGARLRAEGLTKSYGATRALAGVDLEVCGGEVLGLLGPNGAGKSSLIKIACGLVRKDGGQVTVAGHPAGSREARRRTGYLPELFAFPDWALPGDVLDVHQRLAGSEGGPAERERLLELVGLAGAVRKPVRALSKGMHQRLGLAQALVGDPELVLFDEPATGLDPQGRTMVRELLGRLRAGGAAVLLSSHLLGEVERICDRVAVIAEGEVLAVGPPGELGAGGDYEIETDRGTERFSGSREDLAAEVARLVAVGRRVYRVEAAGDRLERAYLDLLGDGP